jgi:hypothetical protein
MLLAPLDSLDEHVCRLQQTMEQAGASVTGGTPVSTDVKRVIYPDRYSDKRGQTMWETVLSLLPGGVPNTCSASPTSPASRGSYHPCSPPHLPTSWPPTTPPYK